MAEKSDTPKRYTLMSGALCETFSGENGAPLGNWVSYTDYAAIERALAAAEERANAAEQEEDAGLKRTQAAEQQRDQALAIATINKRLAEEEHARAETAELKTDYLTGQRDSAERSLKTAKEKLDNATEVIAELLAAVEGEAKATLTMQNAEANYSEFEEEIGAYDKAALRVSAAEDAARALIDGKGE